LFTPKFTPAVFSSALCRRNWHETVPALRQLRRAVGPVVRWNPESGHRHSSANFACVRGLIWRATGLGALGLLGGEGSGRRKPDA